MGVMNEDRLTLYDGLIKTHITNTTVAKETGKGLSTNDYTTDEKNKLAGIADGANKTIVDDALSSTSTNPVQNKVVTSNLIDVRKETTVNLLNPTLETLTQNGVTCTNNGDGTYTLNGTATDSFSFELCDVNLNKFIHKTCLLIDCGKAANSSDKRFGLVAKETTDWIWVSANDSNDYKVILNEYYYTKHVSVRIEGVKGDSYNNAIIKPMLTTDLSATYDDFEPYQSESITVTNDTELPAFGLKSHKGITQIISPANVKCVYPTNESGKGVLDAMYNNSQLSNELSKLKNAIIAMGGTV